MVQGGVSSGGGFLGLSPTSSTPSAPLSVNITLKNVPYVTQYVSDTQAAYRSNWYCGIASALMVRAKYDKYSSIAPPLFYEWQGANNWTVEQDLITIDTNLKNGLYGTGYNRVDIEQNKGLLYIGTGSGEDQYRKTVDVITGVYTGRTGTTGPDYIVNDNRHVSAITMGPESAGVRILPINEMSVVTKEIWDHIKSYLQPVVVVVDSNKQRLGGGIQTSSYQPTLHYIVIRGIRENGSGGTRYFLVHNPAYYSGMLEYTEEELIYLTGLPSNTQPQWVYTYGTEQVNPKWSTPAYILKVQGD
jgi:hypothetical protein